MPRSYSKDKDVLVLGPRMASAWGAMARAMQNNPDHWFSVSGLVEIAWYDPSELKEETLSAIVFKAVKVGALRWQGRKGRRRYQLNGEVEVKVFKGDG